MYTMQNHGEVIYIAYVGDPNHGLMQQIQVQHIATNANQIAAPVVVPSITACEKYRSEVCAASAKTYSVSSGLDPCSSLNLNRIPESRCHKQSLLFIHPVLKFSFPEARAWLPFRKRSGNALLYVVKSAGDRSNEDLLERYEVQEQVEHLTKVSVRRVVVQPQLKAKKPTKRLTNSASTPKISKQKAKLKTQETKTPKGKLKPHVSPNEWRLFTQPVEANTFEEYVFGKKGQLVQPESTVQTVEITKTNASASVNSIGRVQCTTCGQYSANHSFCDSCKRRIPKDAKIITDGVVGNSSAEVQDSLAETANSKKRSHSCEPDVKRSPDHKRQKLSDSIDQVETCCNTNSNMVPNQQCVNSTVPPSVSLSETVQEENVKRAVQDLLSSSDAEAYVELDCSTIWFGNYKAGEDAKFKNFHGILTSVGVLLRLEPAAGDGAVELVLPSQSLIFMGTSVEAGSYLIMRVGNTTSLKISHLLGLNHASQPKFSYGNPNPVKLASEKISQPRFSSSSPCPESQNILLYPKKFNQKMKLSLFQFFGDRWIAFTKDNACELAKIVLPKPKSPKPNSAQKGVPQNRPNGVTLPVAKKMEVVSKSVLGTEDKISTPKVTPAITFLRPTIPVAIAHKTIFRKSNHTLTGKDITHLWPEQFLNDIIIDFWLNHVQETQLTEEDRTRTHVFSTFFYTRLTQKENSVSRTPAGAKPPTAAEKRHRRVSNWTRKFDIFSKDFIIVPINENYHWYVAIICFPGLDGPKWLSDGTAVEDWCNVGSKNNRPVYNLLPGMKDRTDDLPKHRKAELQNNIEKGIVETVNKDPLVQEKLQMNGEGGVSASPLASVLSCKTPINESSPLKSDNNQPQPNSTSVILKISSNGPSKCVTPVGIPKPDQKDEEGPDLLEDILFEDYFLFEDERCVDNETKNEVLSSEISPELLVEQKSSNSSVVEGNTPQDTSIPADKIADATDRKDFRIRQPCILLFDSHKDFSKSKVFNTLRKYLTMEHKVRKGVERDFNNRTMPGFSVNCPQQGNFFDCGLYLLQCVEQFFKSPISSYHLALPYSLRNWFPPLHQKRQEIFEVIRELVRNSNPENLDVLKALDPSVVKIQMSQNNQGIVTKATPNCESQKFPVSQVVDPPSPSAFVDSECEVKRKLEPLSTQLIPLPPGTCNETAMPNATTDAIKDVIPPPCETLEEKVKVDHNYVASQSQIDFEELPELSPVITALSSLNPDTVNDCSSDTYNENYVLNASSTEVTGDMHMTDPQSDDRCEVPVAVATETAI